MIWRIHDGSFARLMKTFNVRTESVGSEVIANGWWIPGLWAGRRFGNYSTHSVFRDILFREARRTVFEGSGLRQIDLECLLTGKREEFISKNS